MSNSTAFLPQSAIITIAAVASPGAAASGTWSGSDKNGDTINITNPTNGIAFCRAGVGAQTAVIGDFAVPPGQSRCLRCAPGSDTLSVLLNTGATNGNVYAQKGDGWS